MIDQANTMKSSAGETEEKRVKTVETLFHGTGTTYDRVVHLATLGRDKQWKEDLLSRMVEPKRVLDLAAGTGILALEMCRRFDCHVTGVELRPEYLDIAAERARANGLDFRPICGNAEEVTLDEQFDHITTCYLPKYVDLRATVPQLLGMLAPGGWILMQDFSYPKEKWVQDIFFDHFARQAEKFKDDPDWHRMWAILPDIVKNSPWVEHLSNTLAAQGCVDIEVIEQSRGMSTLVVGRKPSA
jgi:demethylmenaquinone methyltransferase/2-methoxy-6-polyprenyl-1,4-benzoquinol methylase